jgi:hypothetical protein
MKQPNLAEKIIMMSIDGIQMGISSTIKTFICLILRLLFGSSSFADGGQSKNVSLSLYDTMKIKVGKSQGRFETTDFDNDKLVDLKVTRERESNLTILLSNGKAGFTEAKGSPLFRGLLPNDISILCRYWYANKFDCLIVL